jgi:hypothetical protein
VAYLTRLFALRPILRNVARGMVPAAIAFAVTGVARLAIGAGERTEVQAVAEVTIFVVTVLAITLTLEREILTEFRSYLRRPRARVQEAV